MKLFTVLSLSVMLLCSAADIFGDPEGQQQTQETHEATRPNPHTMQRPRRYVYWHLQRARQERRHQIEAGHQFLVSDAEIARIIPTLVVCEHNPHKNLDR